MKVNKSDIFWGYVAQFFTYASGLLMLPFILRLLTANEIGFNFLMTAIAGLVALLDFGFSVQFSRNFTYVFSGSQELLKEGIQKNIQNKEEINYVLLTKLIYSARFVYRRISLVALLLMLTLGTFYIYNVTNGFKDVNLSLHIWIIFSISTYFNIYYSYYQAILRGKGLIKDANRITIYGRIIQLILTFLLLYSGFGLMGMALANFVYPLFTRYLTYQKIFTKQLKENLDNIVLSKNDIKDTFNIIWHNSKKLGMVFIGAYLISRVGIFLAGIYLPLSEIASYGLLLQIIGILVGFASNYFNSYQPRFNYLRVKEDRESLMKEFSLSMGVFYFIFIFGSICLICIVPGILEFIGSKVVLPSKYFIIAYAITVLMEQNHSFFATLIVTNNNVPFVKPSLIAGFVILVGIICWFHFVETNLWAMVIVPFVVQLSYNNWKWPLVIFKEFDITLRDFLKMVVQQSLYFLSCLYGSLFARPI